MKQDSLRAALERADQGVRESLEVTALPDDRAPAHDEIMRNSPNEDVNRLGNHGSSANKTRSIRAGWMLGELGEVYNRARRLSSNISGDFDVPGTARLPTIEELSTELNLSTAELKHCKREFYQRKFRLWMPMVHEFEDDDEDDGEVEEVELLPVDELLDRVILRKVRISAVERSLMFLLFIFLYFAVLILQRSLADSFELENALKNYVDSGDIKFTELTEMAEVWDWMETSFLDSMTPDTHWYNGDEMEDHGYLHYYNKQCGGFSLVQHRVIPQSSNRVTPSFQPLYPIVYFDLDQPSSTSKLIGGIDRGDSQKAFGPPHDPTKYRWRKDSAGEFKGGGFMVRFPMDRKKARYVIAEMKEDRFVDKATRSLMLIVTIFNANLKNFAVVEFVVNLDAAGRVQPRMSISSVRVDNTVSFSDGVRFLLEIVLLSIMLIHTTYEIKAAHGLGLATYLHFWNVVDLGRQALFYFCFILYVVIQLDPIRTSPEDVIKMCEGKGEWMNFPKLAKLEEDYVFASALCLLISTLLIFKYLTPFPKFGIFVHTMVAAGTDLLNFTLVLGIMLFGFAIIGHLLFGHVLLQYSTVSQSLEAAVYISIGEFDYESLVESSSPAAAAIYFYSFIFIITIVVMQMVIAIIFTAYDGLRERIDHAEELEVSPTIIRKLILFREPSLHELDLSLFAVFKISVGRLNHMNLFSGLRRSAPVTPRDEAGSKQVAPTKFSNNDLLHLFDAQHVFRDYGVLSPSLESGIKRIKTMVAKQRNASKTAAKELSRRLGAKRGSPDNSTSLEEAEEDLKNQDPWSLDREEFCALLHILDEYDDSIHIDLGESSTRRGSAYGGHSFVIGEDSNEMMIANLIFRVYGRRKKGIRKGTFKTRVEEKLEYIIDNQEAANKQVERESPTDSNTKGATEGEIASAGMADRIRKMHRVRSTRSVLGTESDGGPF